ncbi:MAG: DUF1801 domain-containing protein [Chitinophagaceae bacterium]|nr:MAG: DUF1801 domain-containing protein [Chitinophagaceae bacterium]
MLRPIDQWFSKQEEPDKAFLQFMRQFILQQDKHITEAWKYGMPFYCYNGKMFCYLWVHKKYRQPYIGIVEGQRIDHPGLLQEKRARMKILLIDPAIDIHPKKMQALLKKVLALYR